jgi:hypothetical protein
LIYNNSQNPQQQKYSGCSKHTKGHILKTAKLFGEHNGTSKITYTNRNHNNLETY